jgi:hypothetical protein
LPICAKAAESGSNQNTIATSHRCKFKVKFMWDFLPERFRASQHRPTDDVVFLQLGRSRLGKSSGFGLEDFARRDTNRAAFRLRP